MEPQSDTKYKPGDSLSCRIESEEPGGYLVTIVPTGIKGFLPSNHPLQLGSLVPSTFICMNGDTALLAYAYMIGTTERVQFSTASDSENAFSIWVDSHPKSERLKRAVDLIMPPIATLPERLKLDSAAAEAFVVKLEKEQFTGCLKIDSESQPSRSAAVFYKGRIVGGLYTKKLMKDPYPFESSLTLMFEDLRRDTTDIEYYTLPEPLVLSLAALFLGVLVGKTQDTSNEEYAENVFTQFKKRKSIACLSMQQEIACALGFVCRGKYEGAYSVEERRFSPDSNFFKELIAKHPTAQLEAYILPDAIVSESMTFGYSVTADPFNLGVQA